MFCVICGLIWGCINFNNREVTSNQGNLVTILILNQIGIKIVCVHTLLHRELHNNYVQI